MCGEQNDLCCNFFQTPSVVLQTCASVSVPLKCAHGVVGLIRVFRIPISAAPPHAAVPPPYAAVPPPHAAVPPPQSPVASLGHLGYPLSVGASSAVTIIHGQVNVYNQPAGAVGGSAPSVSDAVAAAPTPTPPPRADPKIRPVPVHLKRECCTEARLR